MNKDKETVWTKGTVYFQSAPRWHLWKKQTDFWYVYIYPQKTI